MVWKPSEKEEEHFARLEFERKKKLEEEKNAKLKEEEKKKPKELHPPTQETTALAVEECVTPDRNPFSDGSTMLRRISLTGG